MGNRLYVGNLSFHTTTDVLRQAFAGAGEVTDAHVVTDRETGRSRGFGFITMASEEQAQAAIQAMNGADLDGRPLRVNEAEERPQRGGGGIVDFNRRCCASGDQFALVQSQILQILLDHGGRSISVDRCTPDGECVRRGCATHGNRHLAGTSSHHLRPNIETGTDDGAS